MEKIAKQTKSDHLFTDEELSLIEKYRMLDPWEKEEIIETIEDYINNDDIEVNILLGNPIFSCETPSNCTRYSTANNNITYDGQNLNPHTPPKKQYDFIAIDFETANANRASVCNMALIFFKDGEIVDEKEWLIKPPLPYQEFNPFNVQIHGITQDDIKDKPEFCDIWGEIKPYIEDEYIVAHNAPFDISVLRNVLDFYDLEYPYIDIICTCNVAKKTWNKQLNYSLKTIANSLGYTFRHHDAHDDARICGKILLEAHKYHGTESIEDLAQKIDMSIGYLSPYDYQPCRTDGNYKGLYNKADYQIKVKDIIPQTSDFCEDHPFYDKGVVFTGTLTSMTRAAAMQSVVDVGGFVHSTITNGTNYLVMGIQDFSKFKDGKESNKTKQAKQRIEKGQELQIIAEDDFLNML